MPLHLFNQVDFSLTILALGLSFLLYRKAARNSLPSYPPGPKGLPLLGNLLDIPVGSECAAYDRWCKEFGSDIIYLRVGGNGMVVLNSLEAIGDLLEKRSSTFSSRPRMPMTIEMMGCDWIFAILPYGRAWKERRRLFTQYFHPSRVVDYHGSQTKFVQSMLPRLLDHPEDFLSILQYAISGLGLSLAYGIPIQRENDPYIALAEETIRNIGDAALPTNFLNSGEAQPSFVSETMGDTVLKFNSEEAPTPEQKAIMDAAATALAGASDTTLASIKSFFAAMLCFPDAQRKGQEELDRVLQGRLPTFEDEASLPYINAIVKEVIRWATVTPVAVPHTSDEDDIYKGYFIPKGSIILPNIWALLRDENRYGPDTSAFIPERFLKDGELNPEIVDPATIAFGYGRRECPGKHIALSYLFMSVATVLATFKISEELEENGVPIPPKIEWHSGVISEPAPFKCTITPRSKEAVKLIRALEMGSRLD
ncbi:cytochrome P450 [Agrocybe pediades]|nr:cytochrome P450 [Agrocybe pediades]